MMMQKMKWFLVGLVFVCSSTVWVAAQAGVDPVEREPQPSPPLEATLAEPVIDIWYGSHQVFGAIGSPIPFVNILGRVSAPDGVAALFYTLNGEVEMPLSIGPDALRLADPGDFNVEIDVIDLLDGINTVVIRAIDTQGNESTAQVEVSYSSETVWPARYAINWSRVAAIQDVAQVLDGLWELSPAGVRPLQTDYDRLIAIGDRLWDDYEVTIPITIHAIDPRSFEATSHGAAVGVLLRWPGHADWGDDQPRIGWWPHGAIGLLRWTGTEQHHRTSIQIFGNQRAPFVLADKARPIVLGTTYIYKMRVETRLGRTGVQGSRYRLKIWEQGQPEPNGWELTVNEGLDDPQVGSLVLLSHYVDCVFGNVKVKPLGGAPREPKS